MGFFKEFKEFATKGNLIDIATAFVMGAAFNKFVTSFTSGIVSPLVGLISGGVDFSKKVIVLKEASGEDPELSIKYGELLTSFIDFVIVAFAMFVIIKAINAAKRKKAEEPAAPPAPSSTDQLLMEIRDQLKNK